MNYTNVQIETIAWAHAAYTSTSPNRLKSQLSLSLSHSHTPRRCVNKRSTGHMCQRADWPRLSIPGSAIIRERYWYRFAFAHRANFKTVFFLHAHSHTAYMRAKRLAQCHDEYKYMQRWRWEKKLTNYEWHLHAKVNNQALTQHFSCEQMNAKRRQKDCFKWKVTHSAPFPFKALTRVCITLNSVYDSVFVVI